jgi:hypothetical protein
MCQRLGMPPRLSHISIALREILNLSESSTGPPSRSTIEAVSLMGAETGTPCSSRQVLPFPGGGYSAYLPTDSRANSGNPHAMPKIKSQEEQGATAYRRLLELMADMQWDEEWAIAQFVLEIAEPLGLATPKKTIEQWFDRKSIPSHQIFNVGEALGIAPGWLTDQTRMTKEQAVYSGGLYDREVTRAARRNSA